MRPPDQRLRRHPPPGAAKLRPDSPDPDSPDREESPGQWHEVASSDAITDGSAIEVVLRGEVLAIFRHGGNLYAIDGMCAHQGGPLAEGRVEGGCVTCPWHGWQYELATGVQTINRQPLQKTYQIREQDGMVRVWR